VLSSPPGMVAHSRTFRHDAVILSAVLAIGLIVSSIATGFGPLGYLAGSKTGIALSALLIAGPFLAYAALRAPLISPFVIYVLAVPFDGLMTTAAGNLTKLLALACAPVILGVLLLRRHAEPLPKPALLFLALLAWATTTLLWSVNISHSVENLITLAQLMALYFVVALYPATGWDVRVLSFATVLGGAVAAAYATAESFSRPIQARIALGEGSHTINPDLYPVAFLVPLFIALSTALYTRNVFAKLACGSAVLLIAFGIYQSEARGALVALGCGLLYLIWRARARIQALLIAAGAVALSFARPEVWQRFGDPTQSNGNGRTEIWTIGLDALRHHWLLGSGIGTFPDAYNESILNVFVAIERGWSRASHNLLLGISVELGLIGLILLLLAWAGHFRMLQAIPEKGAYAPIRIALEAGLIALFVASLFVDLPATKLLWLAFMLVCVLYQANRRASLAHSPDGSTVMTSRSLWRSIRRRSAGCSPN